MGNVQLGHINLFRLYDILWFIEHNLAWISSAVYVTSTLWSELFINEYSKGLRVKAQGMNPQPVMDRRWTPIFRQLATTVPIGAGSLREEPLNHVWNSKERRAGSPTCVRRRCPCAGSGVVSAPWLALSGLPAPCRSYCFQTELEKRKIGTKEIWPSQVVWGMVIGYYWRGKTSVLYTILKYPDSLGLLLPVPSLNSMSNVSHGNKDSWDHNQQRGNKL